MAKNNEQNGGPEFPKTWNYHEGQTASFDSINQDGMSLRDWFAGQALAGAVANAYFQSSEVRVRAAWDYADAMIAAREGGAK